RRGLAGRQARPDRAPDRRTVVVGRTVAGREVAGAERIAGRIVATETAVRADRLAIIRAVELAVLEAVVLALRVAEVRRIAGLERLVHVAVAADRERARLGAVAGVVVERTVVALLVVLHHAVAARARALGGAGRGHGGRAGRRRGRAGGRRDGAVVRARRAV